MENSKEANEMHRKIASDIAETLETLANEETHKALEFHGNSALASKYAKILGK